MINGNKCVQAKKMKRGKWGNHGARNQERGVIIVIKLLILFYCGSGKNYSEYDLSVMGGCFDERIIAGGDFAGNVFDAGVRGEGILSIDKNSPQNKFVKFILGSDYQLSPKLYGMIEYQFNGEGKREKLNYEFARLQRGEILNLSLNYLVIMFSYKITPLFTVPCTNNANLNEKSGYLSLAGDYSISENFYLHAGSQFTYGPKFSEYWYYPASLYV